MKNITVRELYYILDEIVLFDVREVEEYQKISIKESINIPVEKMIKNHLKILNRVNKVYLICLGNSRSARVAMFLNDLGYDVTYVKGGITEYKKHYTLVYNKKN